MCTVRTAGHIRRIVQLRCSQSVADARRAVADGDDLVFAVDIGDLVNQSFTFAAGKVGKRFFIGDIASHAAVHAVFRHIADAHAVIAGDLAGTLTAHRLLDAACALSDGILVIFIQPVRDMFNADRGILMFNCLFDRNDVHTDASSSRRNHRGNAFQRHLGHQVEERCQLRVLLCQLGVHHHELSGSRNEDRHIILLSLIRILTRHLQHADPAQMIDHLLRLFQRHAVALCDLFRQIADTCLFEGQKELHFFLCQDHIQSPVFRIGCIQRPCIPLQIAVCNHCRKLQYKLCLFRICRDIIGILIIIPCIGHPVLGICFKHVIPPQSMFLFPVSASLPRHPCLRRSLRIPGRSGYPD